MKRPPEEHLILSLEELQERINKGKQYDLIKASGILRQILIDSPALMDNANPDKLKIFFKTRKATPFNKPKLIDGQEYETLITVRLIDPPDSWEDEFVSTLKRQPFLAYPVFEFENHIFTIKDIIKIGANVLGGVHFDKPKTDRDRLLAIANNMISYADQTSSCASAIKEIGNITIKGLQPLVDKIKTK
jgi:hypothetical protein